VLVNIISYYRTFPACRCRQRGLEMGCQTAVDAYVAVSEVILRGFPLSWQAVNRSQ